MTGASASDARPAAAAGPPGIGRSVPRRLEGIVIPLGALTAGLAAFSVFVLATGKSPATFFALAWRGGFGTWFSVQNTLSHASPLLLAGLCVALPARLGLVVIGGEGAIALGGTAAAVAGLSLRGWPPAVALAAMAAAGAGVGAVWLGAVGALRHFRAVNETIASLLLAYVAIAVMNQLVEGPLRDPASLNKPSTAPLPAAFRIGDIPGTEVHWGLVVGVIACILSWALIERTSWGFAARVAGGNVRAAEVQGLPVGRLIVAFTALGGAWAGLGGMIEVAAVQGSANASLASGYGYTGIVVAFLARQNPLAVIPVSLLLGGIAAAGSLIQIQMGLPNAAVLVLEGMVFLAILASDALYGRIPWLDPDLRRGEVGP
ncbi:MAG: ABC transporter permease [Hyphomicrobiales bacterium]|nr:ABC transporter permease [Hyphomicrobiales bacterium]MDE2017262.1 ABC transporter permease [Hyphomicrobiales bacterium]